MIWPSDFITAAIHCLIPRRKPARGHTRIQGGRYDNPSSAHEQADAWTRRRHSARRKKLKTATRQPGPQRARSIPNTEQGNIDSPAVAPQMLSYCWRSVLLSLEQRELMQLWNALRTESVQKQLMSLRGGMYVGSCTHSVRQSELTRECTGSRRPCSRIRSHTG
jgi:hypothetical protein